MATTTAPKRGGCFGRSIVTVIIVLVVACLVCSVGAYVVVGPTVMNVFNALTAPITASNDFVNAVIANDYTKAYGLVHPTAQSAFGGSPDQMKELLTSEGLVPSNFTATNVNITGDAFVNGTGTFGGSTKYVYITLRKDGDNWKILNIEANNNPPTATARP
jgi:hypothetical protein